MRCDMRRAVRGDRKLEKTYALGGLGVRSTFLMVIRSELWSPWQSSRGDSPGILLLSSKMLRAVAGARQTLSRPMAVENFIAVFGGEKKRV